MLNKPTKIRKKIILFLSPLPPPYYGSAMSSEFCLSILKKSNDYEVVNFKLNYSREFRDMGKISAYKVFGYFNLVIRTIIYSIRVRPCLVYVMPALNGFGFIRDISLSMLLGIINKRMIYHIRTRVGKYDSIGVLKKKMLMSIFRKGDVIVLGDELVGDVDRFLCVDRIHVLSNAIKQTLEDEEYDEIMKRRLKCDLLRIVFISNMMMEKGWFKLLEALTVLKEKNTDFVANFAGSWPSSKEEDVFNRYVIENNLSKHVKYLGFLNQEMKCELLANSDLMVFPTEYKSETFGRVIIEAMEYGLPVITSKVGTIPSIVKHGEVGYLLEIIDKYEISSYVERFFDRKALEEVGKKARKRFLDNYEGKQYEKKFIDIFNHVCNKG